MADERHGIEALGEWSNPSISLSKPLILSALLKRLHFLFGFISLDKATMVPVSIKSTHPSALITAVYLILLSFKLSGEHFCFCHFLGLQ